jgi:predicted aspartyl protease
LANDFRAFTTAYNRISRILKSKVVIGIAFNPATSDAPPVKEFDAIWDTGATGSVISKNVVDVCNLHPIGMTKVHTASGEDVCHVYLVSIGLPNMVAFPFLRVTQGKIEGADVLIGMDVIENGDLAISNYDNKTVFSYRVPSMARIDFVQDINKLKCGRIGRNDPCPCGSGKKYKKCHGQNI